MRSTTTNETGTMRNRIVAAAVTAALLVGPGVAFAANAQGTNTTDAAAATTDSWEDLSNEEWVSMLDGLTDDERAELVALYDKWDALGEDDDLSDKEWARMEELEDKAYYAGIEEAINADTSISDSERADLLAKLDDLKAAQKGIDQYFSDPAYRALEQRYEEASEALDGYVEGGWAF